MNIIQIDKVYASNIDILNSNYAQQDVDKKWNRLVVKVDKVPLGYDKVLSDSIMKDPRFFEEDVIAVFMEKGIMGHNFIRSSRTEYVHYDSDATVRVSESYGHTPSLVPKSQVEHREHIKQSQNYFKILMPILLAAIIMLVLFVTYANGGEGDTRAEVKVLIIEQLNGMETSFDLPCESEFLYDGSIYTL